MTEVHRELVRMRSAELEGDLFCGIALHHQLEILDGCLGDPPVEVEHKRLHLHSI